MKSARDFGGTAMKTGRVHLVRARSADPSRPLVLFQGDFLLVLASLCLLSGCGVVREARSAKTEARSAETCDDQGVVAARAGKLDEAFADFDRAIKLKPDYVEAYLHRGVAHEALGNLEEALADYGEAIKLKPDFVDAYEHRGIIHETRGELDKALAEATEIVALKPADARCRFRSAVINEKLGRKQAAVADYRKAAELGLGPALQKEAEEHLQELQGREPSLDGTGQYVRPTTRRIL
jgi:tetratricopeptide (TPR) repeat protein